MTDKDKMHRTIDTYLRSNECGAAIRESMFSSMAISIYKLAIADAKESSIKELEAAKQRIAELENINNSLFAENSRCLSALFAYHKNNPDEVVSELLIALDCATHRVSNEVEALEKKLATAEEHCELYAAEMSEAKEAGFYSASELYSAYKVMEKNLAEQQAQIKHACWLQMERDIHLYLSANAKGRENGALKATCHIQLCSVLIAVFRGETFFDTELVIHPEFQAVREATQALTGYLDEAIGFPLDNVPDYDALAPMFFDKFYELGAAALGGREEELTKLLAEARQQGFEEAQNQNHFDATRLRRKCVVNPLDMADRLHALEQENEKMKADVAMLRDSIREARNNMTLEQNFYSKPGQVLESALSETASSDAWLNEQNAKVLEEAAQWFDAQEYVAMSDDLSSTEDYAETQLRRMAAELRSPE